MNGYRLYDKIKENNYGRIIGIRSNKMTKNIYYVN